jgi:hypothetical protein
MGLYLRPSRLLKVRISKRGTQVGIGALAAAARRRWRHGRVHRSRAGELVEAAATA